MVIQSSEQEHISQIISSTGVLETSNCHREKQEIRQTKITGNTKEITRIRMDLASATRLVLATWSKLNDFLARKPTHSNDIM